ncbi:unnamed protein product [Linum tenue]|uniref:BHLH domain-containing protein n=1 Tax=Linum tenue TaxID=586396 RepID=A0AAV0J2C1_9ROSI|nr:unnamed protein product [Linum tenue]
MIWNAGGDDVITAEGYNYYSYHHHQLEQGGGQFVDHGLGQAAELLHAPALAAGGSSGGHGDDQDGSKKKVNRKEIERQRRKQMSTLHSSLISLLPHHSLKGKRSMSDHMGEAVNYIKHLESNIGELSSKRDKLKRSSSSSAVDQQQHSTNTTDQHSVTVRPHSAGVEVVTSSDKGGGFELSRVVEAVIQEGFDVTSCVSTQRQARFYNTMQCQVRIS